MLLRISKLKDMMNIGSESEFENITLAGIQSGVDNKTQDLYYFPSSAPTYHYNSNTKLRKRYQILPRIEL